MLSDRCPVCDVVALWVGWIKMKLGIQVGLGPGHTVLDGDLAPFPPKGHSPPPIFGPHTLLRNGWMDQDATWYGGRPRPRLPCVGWGPMLPLPKKGRGPPIFGPGILWPNGWVDEDGTWHGDTEIGLSPGDCVRW